ncbi:alpha/beta fold hydrolase [Mammaliicoccus lentus]|uniref:alpha/beta fold hydrolase n=1 Tax=Mammaliicoccus lentus TaxID=42858 RepID=UPI002B25D045|nr:alpha/beta hydrolase [Mammaliicoccus lentus]WQK50308.1 alpha/beta hydrolase [Mammaliicoccus lentus]
MDNKKTLILLPGMLCDENLWKKQVDYFSGEYRIIVGDLTQNSSIEEMAKNVLKNAPNKFILAGLSLGGIVSFEIVKQAEQRVEKLILLDTNPYLPNQNQINMWHSFKDLVHANEFYKITKEHLLSSLTYKKTDDLENTIIAMSQNIGERAVLKQLNALEFRNDYYVNLKKIKNETHIIVGEHDVVCPITYSEDMKKEIDNSTLDVIEDAGHLSTLEQPEAVINVMKKYI